MPTSLSTSGLRDNHTRGSVAEFLKAQSQPGSNLSIVSAYFTIGDAAQDVVLAVALEAADDLLGNMRL